MLYIINPSKASNTVIISTHEDIFDI